MIPANAFFRLGGHDEQDHHCLFVKAKDLISFLALIWIKVLKLVRVLQSLCRIREVDIVLDKIELGFDRFPFIAQCNPFGP